MRLCVQSNGKEKCIQSNSLVARRDVTTGGLYQHFNSAPDSALSMYVYVVSLVTN